MVAAVNFTVTGMDFGIEADVTTLFDYASYLKVKTGLDLHTHAAGQGAPVARIASCTVSAGNLTFGTTGQRIRGDLSNATLANRLAFQTSTVDGTTGLGVLPNGTATQAQVYATNAADPDNAGRLTVLVNGTVARLATSTSGTGTEPTTLEIRSSTAAMATFTTATLAVAFGGKVTTAASAAGGAGLNLPHGAAPTSPVNGDVWTTTAGLFARINGVTVGPYT